MGSPITQILNFPMYIALCSVIGYWVSWGRLGVLGLSGCVNIATVKVFMQICTSNQWYRIYPCISRPPTLEPKNKFFLFLWKNFLEKLLFYRRISFQIRYGFMKKTTASLDVKFTILLTWAFMRRKLKKLKMS